MPRKSISLYPTQSKSYLIKKDWERRLNRARKHAWEVRLRKKWIYSFTGVQLIPNHLRKEWIVGLRAAAKNHPWPISLRYDVRAAQIELWMLAGKYIHPTRDRNCWGMSDYLARLIDAINKELGQFIE